MPKMTPQQLAQQQRRREHHGFVFRYYDNTPPNRAACRIISEYIKTGDALYADNLPPSPFSKDGEQHMTAWYNALPKELRNA